MAKDRANVQSVWIVSTFQLGPTGLIRNGANMIRHPRNQPFSFALPLRGARNLLYLELV